MTDFDESGDSIRIILLITRSIEEAYRQWCGDNFSREAVYRRLNRLETQFAAGDFSGCITDSEAREMMGRTLPWLR